MSIARRAVASQALKSTPYVAPALTRGLASNSTDPSIKSTYDPSAGKPANPSPPPRASTTTPPPGSQAFQQSIPKAPKLTRRPAKPVTPSPHNDLTRKIVKGLAWIMGYNSRTSTAIRVTSDLYDRCAEIWDNDQQFWQGECQLPPTYQSWFQVTNLHVVLLLLRFRALEPNAAQAYQQELVNHFFIDAENRMRQRFGVQTSRLVKGYMKEMHNQHRGSLLALDESIAMLGADGQGDSRIAMAIWRNVFGAGWGDVGGVLSKVKGVDKDAPKQKNQSGDEATASPSGSEDVGPQLAADLGPSTTAADAASPYAKALAQQRQNALQQGKVVSPLDPHDTMAAKQPELAFPITLARLTRYFLRELRRLAALSDHEVEIGRVSRNPGPVDGRAPAAHISPENSASVGAGEAVERSKTTPVDLHVQSEKSRKEYDQDPPSSVSGEHQAHDESGKSIATFGRP